MNLTVRQAMRPDADAMARIDNDDIERWFDGRHPVVVAERNGWVVGFGATFEYRPRECYAGIAEASVYVARDARGIGAGRAAVDKSLPTATARTPG